MNEENKTEENSDSPGGYVGHGVDLDTAKKMEKMPLWAVVLGIIVVGGVMWAIAS